MTQGTEPGGTQNATRATSMIRQMLGSKPYVTTRARTSATKRITRAPTSG